MERLSHCCLGSVHISLLNIPAYTASGRRGASGGRAQPALSGIARRRQTAAPGLPAGACPSSKLNPQQRAAKTARWRQPKSARWRLGTSRCGLPHDASKGVLVLGKATHTDVSSDEPRSLAPRQAVHQRRLACGCTVSSRRSMRGAHHHRGVWQSVSQEGWRIRLQLHS